MESVLEPGHPPVTFSAFDRLPISIQESILSLLPISSLLLCTSVSRSWRTLIHSRSFTSFFSNPNPDSFFLLFSHVPKPLAAAYSPSLDRWISLSLPLPISAVHASAGSLLMAEDPLGCIAVFDPFARSDPHPILPMIQVSQPYALALISETPPDFKIVAVSTADWVYSQIYDSRSGKWELKGEFYGQFAIIGDAAVLDGLIFCLSRGPDHLLTFDPVGGEWDLLDVVMPSAVVCSHLLVFEGELFLTGGVEEVGGIVRVGIWELDRGSKEWKVCCYMPDEVFDEFSGGGVNHFETVDRRGKVCFYNTAASVVLMCDLSVKRWWWPKPCEIVDKSRRCWFGHALEPHIDLVKRLNGRY